MTTVRNGLFVVVPSVVLAGAVGYFINGWAAGASIALIVLAMWLAGLGMRLRGTHNAAVAVPRERVPSKRIAWFRLALVVALAGEMLGLLGTWLFGGSDARSGLLVALGLTAFALGSTWMLRRREPGRGR